MVIKIYSVTYGNTFPVQDILSLKEKITETEKIFTLFRLRKLLLHKKGMKAILGKLTDLFRKHVEWWQDYMTELSVVILSIAITFYGEAKIEEYNERQEDREVMLMMMNELQENADELESLQKRCTKDVHFSSVLQEYLEQGHVPSPDTLQMFNRYQYLYPQWIFKRNAFDVMKSSGVMQRMDDKELLVLIFDCYDQIEIVKEMGDRYKNERFRMIMEYSSAITDTHEENILKQWKQIECYSPFRDYLCVRFRYSALNVRAFGKRAWQVTDSVRSRISSATD